METGTPEEIYGEPRTSFVADFIGIMNFVPGSVEAEGIVKVGNIVLKCPTDGIAAGVPVSIAIRPEDIDAEGVEDTGDNVVEAEVKHMEFLGSFYRAGLGGAALGDRQIRADFSINLVRRKNVAVGSLLPIKIPAEFIRVYPGA